MNPKKPGFCTSVIIKTNTPMKRTPLEVNLGSSFEENMN
jgi:hypothetical protein